MPIEKTSVDYMLTMSQGFKRGSKCRTSSPAYSFLIFVAYPTIPSSNWEYQPRHDNSFPCMAVWELYRDTEQSQEKENS